MKAVPAAAVSAAMIVAARLGVSCTEPVVLADGANVIVWLSPSPVVAKVAATTPEVRPDVAAWLQRELDVVLFLARPNVTLSDTDTAGIAAAYARLTGELALTSSAEQVLHGDAGLGNLMLTEGGWLWHDFEDTCTGPDFAAGRLPWEAALAG